MGARHEPDRGAGEPFVGRQEETSLLRSALALADGGTAQIVDVVGEPGIGKTRLLSELTDLAGGAGHLALCGRATEFEQEIPLAVVVHALGAILQERGAWLRQRLAATDLAQLADLLPGHVTGTEVTGDVRLTRYHGFRALRCLLEVLAEPAGLVLVLDDVHWADPTSVELLEHLVRQPPSGRIVIALGYRPAQVPARLAGALAETRGDRVHHVRPRPLSRGEATELLGRDLSRRTSDRWYRISGGNPLYLQALRHSDDSGAVVDAGDDHAEPGALPRRVWAALSAEVAALAPVARRAVQAAAVAGDEFEPALVGAVAQTDVYDVLCALDDLVARDLVRPDATGIRFCFRHPLVRKVIHHSAAAGWRVGAHARAAAYLARAGAPAEDQAPHVARSAAFGDVSAIRTLVRAADSAGARAPASAVAWLDAALRLLPDSRTAAGGGEPDGVPSRAELLRELAYRQGAAGRLHESRETMRGLLALLPPTAAGRIDCVVYSALLDRTRGRTDAARALLAAELALRPDLAAPEAVALQLKLGLYAIMQDELDAAQQYLRRVLHAADGQPEAVIARALWSMMGVADPGPAAPDGPATPTAGLGTALLDALPDERIARQIEVFVSLCWAQLYTAGLPESLRHLDRCAQVATDSGQSLLLPYVLAAKSFVLARVGRLAEASAAAVEGADLARLLGASDGLAVTLLSHCWTLRCSGDHDDAVRVGRQAVAAADESRSWTVTARAMLGFARISAGDVEAGRAELEAAGGPDLVRLFPHNRLIACTVLAEEAARRGNAGRAQHWADLADGVPDPGHGVGPGLAALAAAYAMGVARPADAAVRARTAAAQLAASGLHFEAGRAWLLAGGYAARIGDRTEAHDALARAELAGERCGARALHAEAAQLRRHLDADDAPPADLTRRESMVLALLAKGITADAIAHRLSISPRTVHKHLEHLYRKLGTADRMSAVLRATDLGLLHR
ncbi:AAA family ATPase [Krasilnikovia sp. MM14-A1259]|uniref:helix-turn-helix transcriptional regulator n=1 Tax=Krasilnikovia sp. MM14-A1259 TaxID=3373539 RepID=UPI00382C9884